MISCSFRLSLPSTALVLVAWSCSSPELEPDMAATEAMVAEALGEEVVLAPLASGPDEAQIGMLLADGLTLEEAQLLTLQNNKHLQALLLEVGIKQAERIQAGLLSNPTLDLSVRFPGDGTGNLLDALLGFELLELWQIPVRERMAEFAWQVAVAEVARAAVGHLRDTREAFLTAQIADRNVETLRRRSEIASSVLEAERELAYLGMVEQRAVEDLEFAHELAMLAWQTGERERAEAKQALARAISYAGAMEAVELVEPFADRRIWAGDPETLVEKALMQRQDLAAMEWKVQALEQEVLLRGRARFGALSGGPNYEDPGAGETALGPAVSWSIPLFDQGQAGLAKARLAEEQARLQWQAALADVAQEVRGAWSRLQAAEAIRARLSEELLPLAQNRAARIGEGVELGTHGTREYLEAQDQLLEVVQELLQAEWEVQAARWGLEWALGAPFPE